MPVFYFSLLLTPLIIFPVDLLKFKLTFFKFLMLKLYRRKRGKLVTSCFTSITKVLSIVMSEVGLYLPIKARFSVLYKDREQLY